MKRMRTILPCILILSALLVGCGSKVPELSEEESALISEYAAGMLLKYDTKHQSRLVDTKKIEEERAQEEAKKQEIEAKKKEEEQKKAEKEAAENPKENVKDEVEYASISEFLGIDGVDISYTGYEICEKYPQDDIGFSLNATAGKKLIVLKFNAKNQTSEDILLELISLRLRGRVAINGEETIRTLTTMLLNDMSTYQDTIVAGETRELVLIFEAQEDGSQNLTAAILTLQKDDTKMDINLLQ